MPPTKFKGPLQCPPAQEILATPLEVVIIHIARKHKIIKRHVGDYAHATERTRAHACVHENIYTYDCICFRAHISLVIYAYVSTRIRVRATRAPILTFFW